MPESRKVKIRVTDTPSTGKFSFTKHPTEHRCIVVGDEFEAESYEEGTAAEGCRWEDVDGIVRRLPPRQYTILSSPKNTHACTCPLATLMRDGCQCGGL